MGMMISSLKPLLIQTIKLKSVFNFLKMAIVLMELDVNLFIKKRIY